MTDEPMFELSLTKNELAAVFGSVGQMVHTVSELPEGHVLYKDAQAELRVFKAILLKALMAKDQHPEAFEEAVKQ